MTAMLSHHAPLKLAGIMFSHAAPQVLTDHSDEVWHVAFSHDGTMLASASKDMTAVIYKVQRQEQRIAKHLVLTGHTGSIGYLGWSPDDTMLATCGNDMILRLWNSSTGECLQEMSHHSKEVSSVAWLPDSEFYIMLYENPLDVLLFTASDNPHLETQW